MPLDARGRIKCLCGKTVQILGRCEICSRKEQPEQALSFFENRRAYDVEYKRQRKQTETTPEDDSQSNPVCYYCWTQLPNTKAPLECECTTVENRVWWICAIAAVGNTAKLHAPSVGRAWGAVRNVTDTARQRPGSENHGVVFARLAIRCCTQRQTTVLCLQKPRPWRDCLQSWSPDRQGKSRRSNY